MVYLQLFFAFLYIGALSFGGGYAAMPLIQAQVIDKYTWMTINDFSSLVAIAEMTPGPIAVNAATFVGHQTAGMLGSIVATIGVILPSCFIVTILAFLYQKYRKMELMQGVLKVIRPTVISFIAAAGITIMISTFFKNGLIVFQFQEIEGRSIIYFLLAMFLLKKKKMDSIKVMMLCGGLEGVVSILLHLAKR